MLQRLLRTLAGLGGAFFVLLGLAFFFAPGRLAAQFAVAATGPAGYGTLRADLGAFFLGAGAFAVLGAVRNAARWLFVSTAFLWLVLAGRLLNLLSDGRSPESLRGLAIEVVLLAVLFFAASSARATQVAARKGVRPPEGSLAFLWLPALALLLLGGAALFQRQIGVALTRRFVDRAFANDLLAALPDGLHVGLCGSGSPMPDANRAGPCVVVIAGKRVYLVDSGEGSPRKLALMGVNPGAVDGVLLTHFHSDHIGALGELMLQRWAGASHHDPLPVYGPQGVESVVAGFNAAYALDKGYRVAHHGEATLPPSGHGGLAKPFQMAPGSEGSVVVLQQDGLTITAFPVPHAPVVPAVGYRFDYQGRSAVVSGDTSPSRTLTAASRGVDLLLHEGLQTTLVTELHEGAVRAGRSSMAKITADIPSYHTTPEDAARAAQEAGARRLVFFHTIPPIPAAFFNAAFLGDAPALFKGPITVGKDGMLFSLPAGSGETTQRDLL